MFRQARLRPAAVGLAAAIAAGAAAPTALAHGIGGDATDKSVIEFVPLGIEHMLLGWDHLLFIVGIVILAGGLRRAAKLISLFVGLRVRARPWARTVHPAPGSRAARGRIGR